MSEVPSCCRVWTRRSVKASLTCSERLDRLQSDVEEAASAARQLNTDKLTGRSRSLSSTRLSRSHSTPYSSHALGTDLPRACFGSPFSFPVRQRSVRGEDMLSSEVQFCFAPRHWNLSNVVGRAPAWQQVFHQHFRAQHSWRPSFLYHGLLVWSMVWRLRVCSQRPVKRAGRSTKDDEQVLTASVHKCCMESALAPPEGSCAARHAPSSRQESQSGAAHFLGVGSSCAGYTQR